MLRPFSPTLVFMYWAPQVLALAASLQRVKKRAERTAVLETCKHHCLREQSPFNSLAVRQIIVNSGIYCNIYTSVYTAQQICSTFAHSGQVLDHFAFCDSHRRERGDDDRMQRQRYGRYFPGSAATPRVNEHNA